MADDDRVRCGECRHRTGELSVPVRRYLDGGSIEVEYDKRKVCRWNLGYDPAILRRCEKYEGK